MQNTTSSLRGLGKEFFPHQLLRLDFIHIHEEAKRQELIHPANKNGAEIAGRVFSFFDGVVIPSILQSDWTFQAAKTFAEVHALPYFHTLRLIGEQTTLWQNKFLKLNDRIITVFSKLAIAGKAPLKPMYFPKGSDFVDVLFWDKLNNNERQEVEELQKEIIDHENLHLTLTLRNIGDVYEMGLPRIFFVIKRAMVEHSGLRKPDSDSRLLQPSDYIDWYTRCFDHKHELFELIGSEDSRRFYKAARNVRGHHRGLKWDKNTDTVYLEDEKETLAVHIHELSRRHRFLDYLCTYGTRAILLAFCERDLGSAAMMIYQGYEKLFPQGFPSGEGRGYKSYPNL